MLNQIDARNAVSAIVGLDCVTHKRQQNFSRSMLILLEQVKVSLLLENRL